LTELLGGKADWIWGYTPISSQYRPDAKFGGAAIRHHAGHFMTVDAAGRSGADIR